MPGLLTMRPLGAASKAARSSSSRTMSKAKTERAWDERGSTPSAALIRIPSANMTGCRPSQLHASGPACRPKQVTEAVTTEKVMSMVYGPAAEEVDRVGTYYSSSGSEHEPSSVCLAAMVHEFMEHETENGRCGRSRCNCEAGTCAGSSCYSNDDDDSKSSFGGELSEILQGLTQCISATERILLTEVNKALIALNDAAVAGDEDGAMTCFRRSVMKHIRSAGYNAAICKSRWDHAGGFPGGDYEYIDVIFESATGKSERILIDVEFKAQFEIARPTSHYNAVLHVLPAVFVGKADRLQQIVNVMSDAVKLSLKKRGMYLPPWRKPEYMRAKWFSSYRRTTKEFFHKKSDEMTDISSIAVRGSGWDVKYTDEMEMDYRKVEAQPVVKEVVCRSEQSDIGKKSEQLVVPTTVENTDWQPPALKPRISQRPGLTGLSSILKEAGLIASIRKLNEEQGSERKSLAMAA